MMASDVALNRALKAVLKRDSRALTLMMSRPTILRHIDSAFGVADESLMVINSSNGAVLCDLTFSVFWEDAHGTGQEYKVFSLRKNGGNTQV